MGEIKSADLARYEDRILDQAGVIESLSVELGDIVSGRINVESYVNAVRGPVRQALELGVRIGIKSAAGADLNQDEGAVVDGMVSDLLKQTPVGEKQEVASDVTRIEVSTKSALVTPANEDGFGTWKYDWVGTGLAKGGKHHS